MWSAPRSLGPPSLGVSVRKVLTVCALTALMAVSGITVSGAIAADPPAAAPAASPAPSPTSDPLGDFTHYLGSNQTDGLAWQPATDLGLEEDASLSRLTALAGGFAVLEQCGDPDDPEGYAVQVSSDGRSWQRSVLPDGIEEVEWLHRELDCVLQLESERGGFRTSSLVPDRTGGGS